MAGFTKKDERFMRLAIKAAADGVRRGQTPFGSCIVKDGKVVACAHNVVWSAEDITAHAEVTAIRRACRKLDTVDLSGCTVYSTTEPCPMCFSACHWARIDKIIYGTSIKDAKKAGFHELPISDHRMKREGKSKVKVFGGFMKGECAKLFTEWLERGDRKAY